MKKILLSIAFILGLIAIVVIVMTIYAFFAFVFGEGDMGDLLRWAHNPLYSATIIFFSVAAIIIGHYKKEVFVTKLYQKMESLFR